MLEKINAFVWGVPGLILLLGAGLYLTWRTDFVQVRLLVPSLKRFAGQFRSGGSSQFRALCTALAATVGTGNIAGVAGAIAIGGPGAVFWMWVSGFIGMATKYAEAVLAVRYREKNNRGEWVGGPMYIIKNGMGKRFLPLAYLYSFFGLIASLGVGNAAQINAVIGAVDAAAQSYGAELGASVTALMGLAMALLVYCMVSGGARKIGSAAELLVPLASVVYIVLCLGVIGWNFDRIGKIFYEILTGAFSPEAVTGGAVGSAVTAMRLGVSRGVFSNEAGMGTASMAHAGAEVEHPAHQGMMGIVEVFIDTIVICTMTALVILISGVPIGYGSSAGSELTAAALSRCCGPWVTVVLSGCLCLFAFATILGWGLYAGRCFGFLFGSIRWRWFAAFQAAGVFFGAVLDTGAVWSFAETVNALMSIPNIIALIYLSGQVRDLTCDFLTGFPEESVI